MDIFKKVKLLAFIILVCIIFIGFFTKFVDAQSGSDEKTFYLNDKQINNETLFTNDNVISPGDKITREFYVKNNNDFECTVKSLTIDGELKDKAGNVLEKGMPEFNNFMNNSIITVYYNNKEISKQNLSNSIVFNFADDNKISIEKNATKEFIIEYTLNRNADNSIQGFEYKFNIGINYSSIDGSENNATDNGGGVSLVQTGTFVDNKLLTTLGICFLVIGLLFILSKDVFKKKSK